MFFLSKGSLNELQNTIGSYFRAASQANSIQFSTDITLENQAPLVFTTKPLIWRVTGINKIGQGLHILNVFDGDKNACVFLDSLLEYMITDSDADSHRTIREGSVVLCTTYCKHDAQCSDSEHEPKIIVKNLIVIGYDKEPMPNGSECKAGKQVQGISNEKLEDLTSVTISKLRPSLKNTSWSLVAKLYDSTPVREFVNRSNSFKGKLVRLLLQDSTGFLECVAFNDMIERHGLNLLRNDSLYFISEGQIKYSSPKMKAWPEQVSSDFELVLTDTTTIKEVNAKPTLSWIHQAPWGLREKSKKHAQTYLSLQHCTNLSKH